MTIPKLATSRSGYGGRGYRIPGRVTMDGDKSKQMVYPSVTTVLNAVAKPALMQWAADQTAAFAVANISYLMQQTEEIGWGYLRFYWSRSPELVGSELRLHHEGVRDDAAELGTNIHEWFEAELDGTIPYPALISVEAEQMADALVEFGMAHEIIVHGSEFTVVNDRLGIAGTADADWSIKCTHDGETCLGQPVGEFVRALVDVKTSRHTWNEHGMQLTALATAPIHMVEVAEGTEGALPHEGTLKGVKSKTWWTEKPAPEYERIALLHVRPRDLDKDGDVIEPFCHLIDMTDEIDTYQKGFLGALALTEMTYELKQAEKAKSAAREKKEI